MILLDADDNPKIKLYTDKATGLRNGDGLVIYYKEESVELALSLLDESPLRLGDKENMKVVKAEWSHKQGENSKGNSNGDDEKSRKAKSSAQAQKMQRRAEKLQREAADYDPSYDERAAPILSTTATKPSGRVVVLAHVFTLEELAEDASLLLDLKEDVREECESLGKVTNVVLYDVSAARGALQDLERDAEHCPTVYRKSQTVSSLSSSATPLPHRPVSS